MADKVLFPALKITLYDPETDAVVGEYSRSFIPFKILKTAVRLLPKLDLTNPEDISEEVVDLLADLVVEVFGGKFPSQELLEGADLGEMIDVVQNIVARASRLMPANPIRPGN